LYHQGQGGGDQEDVFYKPELMTGVQGEKGKKILKKTGEVVSRDKGCGFFSKGRLGHCHGETKHVSKRAAGALARYTLGNLCNQRERKNDQRGGKGRYRRGKSLIKTKEVINGLGRVLMEKKKGG